MIDLPPLQLSLDFTYLPSALVAVLNEAHKRCKQILVELTGVGNVLDRAGDRQQLAADPVSVAKAMRSEIA